MNAEITTHLNNSWYNFLHMCFVLEWKALSTNQQIKYTLSLHLLLLLADREHPAAITINSRGTSKLPFGNYLLMVLKLTLYPEAVEDMKWALALAKTVPGPSQDIDSLG